MENVAEIKYKLCELVTCNYDDIVFGISLDSRTVKDGFLFAALSGTHDDGEKYINPAINAGAKFILTRGESYKVYKKDKCIIIEDREPRKLLALICCKFYPNKLQRIAAITGTNGKTSTVDFLRQIWSLSGEKSASIGTLGVISSEDYSRIQKSLTSPDPISLNRNLQELSNRGVCNVALEASSHGLDQYRMFGLNFDVVAFTNFSQDHLDYHSSMEEYFNVKSRLFSQYISRDTKCVLNTDSERFHELQQVCIGDVITYGRTCGDIHLISLKKRNTTGYNVVLQCFGEKYETSICISSNFQLSNMLCAVAMACSSGTPLEKVLHSMSMLHDVVGRMQHVGNYNGGSIYVDYAHTPDGLRTALEDVKNNATGKLIVVFGCGGERDVQKRKLMGSVAESIADLVIVTDDNPRNEDPAAIRSAIMSGCKNAIEIPDRHVAISEGIKCLHNGDVLLIAGKGHENYQLIGNKSVYFSDAYEVNKNISIFTTDEINTIFHCNVTRNVHRISFDSRDIQDNDLFVALKGEHFDGNDYISEAMEKGASVVICNHTDIFNNNIIVVNDTLSALQKLGSYARQRRQVRIIGITGSVGKSTTRGMLSLVLGHFENTFSSIKNYNSQIGVPICLSMIPQNAKNAVIEMGMGNTGDLSKLTELVDQNVSIITNVSECHLEFFKDLSEIVHAKSEIFSNGIKQDFTIIPGDKAYSDLLRNNAIQNNIKQIYTFGNNSRSDAKILSVSFEKDRSLIHANVLGNDVSYSLRTKNEGIIVDSVIPLLYSAIMGYCVNSAADILSEKFTPLSGRGEVYKLRNGSIIIDDTYNACPSSMIAAIKSLKTYNAAKRVAILGDMGELGQATSKKHSDLHVYFDKINDIYLCGEHMLALHKELQRSHWFNDVESMLKSIDIHANSVVLVKASRYMKFDKIVDYLKNNIGVENAI